MNETIAKHIFLFLLGTSILNFVIALVVRVKTKHKEFNTLLFYWPSIFLTFVAAAVLSATPNQIAFAYFFQVISSNLGVYMLCSSQGITFEWKKHLTFQVAVMSLTTYLILYTNVGFTLSLLPTCLGFTVPFIKPIWHALVKNRENSNWLEKTMGYIFISAIINHFNYAFFRLDPDAAFWGWGICVAQYQCLSLFLPLLLNHKREENEKTQLKQALEKLSGHTYPVSRTDELYDQLELQISEKELYASKLKVTNLHLEEEREMNEMLIRTISHDLANPLTVIGAYIEMLHKGRIPAEEIDKIWSRVKINTQSSLDMIGRIRNAILTRTQASLVKPNKVSIDACMKRVNDMFENRLREKNITLNYQNNMSSDTMVLADENALAEHVFANIISNAIKFSFQGSEIQITVKEIGETVQIDFRDFGTGIKDSRLEKRLLFSTEGTNGETGTGFGLMVMGYFLRQFDAQVKMTSLTEGPKKGTLVSISLKKSLSNEVYSQPKRQESANFLS